MSHPNLPITDAEWDVMQAVWQADGQTAGDIIAKVQETRDWNHRTIRTLLSRLVDKGAIDVTIEGAKHFYHAAISRQDCVRSAAKSFSERFFSGDVKSLLMHFVENEKISNEELEDIRKTLLSKSRSPRPKQMGPKQMGPKQMGPKQMGPKQTRPKQTGPKRRKRS